MSRSVIRLSWHFLVFTLVCIAAFAFGAERLVEFETEQQEIIYAQLLKDHRCLKCQNQNLADSNASIADSLRTEIYQQVIEGKSRDEISTYLVDRYGDFVLYRPPFKATTYALWIGPFVLLFIALFVGVRLARKAPNKEALPDEQALAEARSLLNEK